MRPNESDWNAFRRSVPAWRDRYLNRINAEIARQLEAGDGTPADRFWSAHDRVREEARLLRECFDDLRRSRMHTTLHVLLDHGMIDRDELADFSDDLQHRLRPWDSDGR